MDIETPLTMQPKEREDAPGLYWRIFDIIAPPMRTLHRARIVNAHNLPATGEGGAIIAGLHNGALDGLFIAMAAAERGRAVRFVADEDICNAPGIGKTIREAGCIPIASVKGKGTDPEKIRAALAEAAALLEQDRLVGVFPEGIIHPFFETQQAFTFKTGVIRLAIETQKPIIPTWARGAAAIFPWLSPFDVGGKHIYGMLPVWTPVSVKVHFGEPFIVNPELTLESPHEIIKREALRLQREVDKLRNKYRDRRKGRGDD